MMVASSLFGADGPSCAELAARLNISGWSLLMFRLSLVLLKRSTRKADARFRLAITISGRSLSASVAKVRPPRVSNGGPTTRASSIGPTAVVRDMTFSDYRTDPGSVPPSEPA